MKRIKRGLCLILTILMLGSCVPAQALEAPAPELLPAAAPDADNIEAGAFYLGSGNVTLDENGGGRLLLVGRSPDEMLGAKQVRLVITDITAHYGEDYTISEYSGNARVKNAGDSTALIDLILEDPERIETCNNTDTLIETGILPSQGTEIESSEELSDEEMAEMNAALREALYGEEESPAVLDDSLRQAKSLLTGLESDRTPMTNSAADEDITGKLLEAFSEELNCASITLSFAEGVTEKYVEISPKNNLRGDGDRIFTLTLMPACEDAAVAEGSGLTVTIRDDEEQTPATVTLTSSEYRPEDGYVRVGLERSGAENQTVSVRLTTEDGTAVEGQNYSGVDADVVFPFGVKENYINIPVCSDAVEDTADFSVSLSEPNGAVLGETQEAGIVISASDESFSPQLTAGAGGIRLGETMKGFSYAYNCRHSSDSHADSKVTREYDGSEGEYIKFFADWPTWNCSGSTWVGCNLKMNKDDNFSQSLFYEGVRIRGESCNDSDDDDEFRVRVMQVDKDGSYSSQRVLSNRLDYYKNRQNIDIYFRNSLYCYDLYTELYRDDGGSRIFRIFEWSPILRPFTVQLLQADPLEYYNEDGILTDNTAIGGLEHANQALLQLPNSATGTKGTFYYGDTINVLRKEDSNPVSKLTSFSLTDKNGNRELPLTLGTAGVSYQNGAGGSSLSFALDMDSPGISSFLMPSSWDITTCQDGSSRNGMYDITAYIKPAFGYINTQLKIYHDERGEIGFQNGTYYGEGSDEYGSYSLYIVHQGDYIHLLPAVNDSISYITNGVRVMAESSVGTDEFTQHIIRESGSPNDGYARFRNGNYTEIRVFPAITERKNAVRVRVDKNDAALFQNMGIFSDPGVLASETDCGSEYEYTVIPETELVPGQYYTMNAFPAEGVAEWLVTTADGETRTYCQNTFAFLADSDVTRNTVRLRAPVSSSSAHLSVSITALARQAQIGGAETYTVPAENAVVVLDEENIGLCGSDGSVSFRNISVPAHDAVTYRRICVYYGASSFYRDLVIPAAGSGDSVRLSPEPVTLNVAGTTGRPSFSDVTAYDEYGTNSVYIAIDGTRRFFSASVAADHTDYSDSAGVAHEESITNVSFVVIDPDTQERKLVLPANKSADGKTWQAEWVLYSGYEDKYAVGDQVWVEMTTDRLIGDGKAYTDGSTGEKNEYLRKTVYPLMPTKLVFTTSVPVEQPPQNIAIPDDALQDVMDVLPDRNGRYSNGNSLPFIENFSLNMSIGRVKISMTPHPADSSKIVLSFGFGIINKGILNKDKNGWYQPGENPDPDLIAKLDNTKDRMGTDKFGYAGRFFGKPKWDVSVGLNLIMKKAEEPAGSYDVESGVVFVAVNGSFSYNAYFLVMIVPVYFCGQFSGKILVGAKLYSSVPVDPTDSGFFGSLKIAFQTSALVTVDIYAGVGIAGFLGVRGGVNFTLNLLFDSSLLDTDMCPTGLQFVIYGKVWVDLLVKTLDYRWEIIDPLNLGYYKDAADAKKQADFLPAQNGAPVTAESYQLNDKVLDGSPSEWRGDDPIPSGGVHFVNNSVLMKNGYDFADPQLLYMGEDYGTLLVFVDKRTDGETDVDNTVLKYSIFDGTDWSRPRVLYETFTADFQPSLCDTGDRVLVSWVSRDIEGEALAYAGDINELLKDLDVYTVEYDKVSGTVDESSFTRLTDDRYFNSEPQAVYVPDTGDTMVFFQKSEVVSRPALLMSAAGVDTGDADSVYLSNVLPTANNCEIAFMTREGDSGEWNRSYTAERERGILSAAQADALEEELGGQRFLSTPIRDLNYNDPLLTDLDTVAFERYVLYAFSVDADNDLATGDDRALYLQVYDSKSHITYDPVRIRTTDVIQSNPQILLRPGEGGTDPTLFWLEDGENICYTSLLPYLRTVIEQDTLFAQSPAENSEGDSASVDFTNPDNLFPLGGVFFGSADPESKPSLNSYNACSDREGNLYITWNQQVYENGVRVAQEVFASALITPALQTDGTAWSEGVRLTYSGKVNDQQVITVDGSGRIIVVSNQLSLDMDKDGYSPRNITMVASIIPARCTMEITGLKADNETPVAGETVTVSGYVKNTGLLTAHGYQMDISGGYEDTITEENAIAPSGKTAFSFNVTIPEDGSLPDLTFRLSQIYADGRSVPYSQPVTLSPFRSGAVYSVTDARTFQDSGDIYLECTVANYGNAASDGSDYLTIGRNNADMDFDAEETVYLRVPVEEIPAGSSETFLEKLAIPESDFNGTTANAYVCVENSTGDWLTRPVALYIGRTVHPASVIVPGTFGGRLILSEGQELSLAGVTCEPALSAENARYVFSTDNSGVAAVENGVLHAVSGGSTLLTVTVLPYGDSFAIPVTVQESEDEPQAEPEPAEQPEQKKCSRGEDCPLHGFSDLEPDLWYHDGIEFCLKNSLMVGVSDSLFAPSSAATRGMMMTILARMEQQDGPCTPWYEKGRAWAMAAGISDGTGPELAITREQFAAMLYRYAGYRNIGTGVADSLTLNGFADRDRIHDWALDSMEWACRTGIILGKGSGILDPGGLLTRAEAATMLSRYCSLFPN